MNWPLFIAAVLLAGLIAWHWGRAFAPRDPQPLRQLLGKEESPMAGPERQRVAALEDALVKAGWVHTQFVADPEHYDEAGRYLWWNM